MNKKNVKHANEKNLENYFLDIISTDRYKTEIKSICVRYNVNPGAYTKNESGSIPREWMNLVKKETGSLNDVRDLKEDIKKLVLSHDLPEHPWVAIVCEHIFLGSTDFGKDAQLVWIRNRYQWEDIFNNIDDFAIAPERPDTHAYPIEILVSPYASKNDIRKALDASYTSYIKPIQDAFKKEEINLGRLRTRVNRERDDFIYENRDLPAKKIMRITNEKFSGIIDYSEVNKIISLERERRK